MEGKKNKKERFGTLVWDDWNLMCNSLSVKKNEKEKNVVRDERMWIEMRESSLLPSEFDHIRTFLLEYSLHCLESLSFFLSPSPSPSLSLSLRVSLLVTFFSFSFHTKVYSMNRLLVHHLKVIFCHLILWENDSLFPITHSLTFSLSLSLFWRMLGSNLWWRKKETF